MKHTILQSVSSLALLLLFVINSQAKAQTQNQAQSWSIKQPSAVINQLIEGSVQPDEALSYRLEPFSVPEDIGRIEVTIEYEGKSEYAEIEIGLYDPERFRGTSRFSKKSFFVELHRATASYHPGPILPGNWNISLAFPTITQSTNYRISITMTPLNNPAYTGASDLVVQDEQRWYAGDFHTHTGHSDGFGCQNIKGERGPCQVYQIVEAATRYNLDFVGIADHNTVSHHQDMAIIQPLYPDLLLVRGVELTTYFGHANIFGSSIPIDFRLGHEEWSFLDVQKEVERLGATVSLNHPGRKTGASCTGCGWNAPNTAYDRLQVIEIINGTNVENEIAGIPFWQDLLDQGYKITGIGGSDDHGAGFGSAHPGIPTTMVYASKLSEKSLLDAVKEGNVYLKTKGPDGPSLDWRIELGAEIWHMGMNIPKEILESEQDSAKDLILSVAVNHEELQTVEIIHNSQTLDVDCKAVGQSSDMGALHWSCSLPHLDAGWIRLNLRNASTQEITVVANPIYLGRN